MKQKLFFFLIAFFPVLACAIEFTPYVPDEDNELAGDNGVSLYNWRDPESGQESQYDYFDYMSGTECTSCAGLLGEAADNCLDAIYNQGVEPVYKEDGVTVDHYEFPGCPDPQCPLHHLGGWAANADGSISSVIEGDPAMEGLYPADPKLALPLGEPLVMLLFGALYGAVIFFGRRKQLIKK